MTDDPNATTRASRLRTRWESPAYPEMRCRECHLNWHLFPPAKITGEPFVRCVECKSVYPEETGNVSE